MEQHHQTELVSRSEPAAGQRAVHRPNQQIPQILIIKKDIQEHFL